MINFNLETRFLLDWINKKLVTDTEHTIELLVQPLIPATKSHHHILSLNLHQPTQYRNDSRSNRPISPHSNCCKISGLIWSNRFRLPRRHHSLRTNSDPPHNFNYKSRPDCSCRYTKLHVFKAFHKF